MGRYKEIAGADTVREQTGMVAGKLVTVRLWRREMGSTVGILFVSIVRDRTATTEQFSGERRRLAYRTYFAAVEQLKPINVEALPAPVAPAVPVAPTEPVDTSHLSPAQRAVITRRLRAQGLIPAAPAKVAPATSDDLAARRREAALKAAATRKARQAAGL